MAEFDWKKRIQEIEAATGQAIEGSGIALTHGDGYRVAKIISKDGHLDYAAYRRAQSEGNRLKLKMVYAKHSMIRDISRHARRKIGDVKSILCHGTRNGRELEWFSGQFPEAEILGTDIADTAGQFGNTIQWDFHDMREDWRGKWNVVYTNSWDHAMEPERAFRAWADSLAPGGILYLEHGRGHGVDGTSTLDLFGASRSALKRLVSEATGLKPMWPVGWLHRTRKALPFIKA